MREINRILLQLNKAVECSNSTYPQERGIAVILFDNIVELQLIKKSKFILTYDRTTWLGSRDYDAKFRHNIFAHYDELLRFSKKNQFITEKDYEILTIAHKIRNEIYHSGELDALRIDLAILIFYDFFQRVVGNWNHPNGLVCITSSFSGYERIDFGQGVNNEIFDYKKYFKDALQVILNRINFTDNLTKKVQTIIDTQVSEIERAKSFICSELKNLNFYDVLKRFWYLNTDFFNFVKMNRKPKNIDSILLIYAFLRTKNDQLKITYQDYLDDKKDLKVRQKEGKKLLKQFRSEKNGKYPYWVDLQKIKEQAKELDGKTSDVVLNNLVDIQSKIGFLYLDITEAASNLDGYIMEAIDFARGK